MVDILLDADGDIFLTPDGDISVVDNIRQAVLIRLRWIAGEWRLGPGLGFPWYEEVFVKNPNIPKLRSLIREEILAVEGVTGAEITDMIYDGKYRSLTVRYKIAVGETIYKEEAKLYAGIRTDTDGT